MGDAIVNGSATLERLAVRAAELVRGSTGLAGPASDAEIAAYDFRMWDQQQRARRERRSAVLDRELPGELSRDGRRAVVHEIQPHTLACDLVLSWASRAAAGAAPPALAMVGERGIGKTVAAAWWIADTDGRYVLSTEVVRLWRAKDSFGREAAADRQRFESLKRSRVLAIDEVGGERHERADVLGAIEEIVNARQSERTRTLWLGNITAGQWRDRLTSRAASRWDEVGFTLEMSSRLDMRRHVRPSRLR